jgi:hypothetical protein
LPQLPGTNRSRILIERERELQRARFSEHAALPRACNSVLLAEIHTTVNENLYAITISIQRTVEFDSQVPEE